MNDSISNQTEKRSRSLVWTVCVHVLWSALLFVLVAGLALYAVASSFPIPGGSDARSGTAAVCESIGVAIMQVIHGPFSWLYSVIHDAKLAGALVWLIWAAALYLVSALMQRPRWVFPPRAQLQ